MDRCKNRNRRDQSKESVGGKTHDKHRQTFSGKIYTFIQLRVLWSHEENYVNTSFTGNAEQPENIFFTK